MYVDWDNSGYDGAPAINLKRPYGNSWVAGDVAEILGWEYDYEDEMPEQMMIDALKIHRETAVALQICLRQLDFSTGVFVRDNAWSEWAKTQYVVERLEVGDFLYFRNDSELIDFAKLIRDENLDNEMEIEYTEEAIEYIVNYCSNLELDGGNWVLD